MVETREELKELITEMIYEILEEEQLLNETTVIRQDKYKIAVHKDNGSRLKFDPYFKVAPVTEHSFKRCARISILRPEYIVHDGINLELAGNVKKDVLKLISNVWSSILEEIIKVVDDNDIDFYNKIRSLPMPDYSNISYSPTQPANFRKEIWRK